MATNTALDLLSTTYAGSNVEKENTDPESSITPVQNTSAAPVGFDEDDEVTIYSIAHGKSTAISKTTVYEKSKGNSKTPVETPGLQVFPKR
ncbi:hypothetical protein HPULCUR_008437 [Helicostylum pulchrum]|uniref:Uncharacterized protein n=1 Tax=Helicostylum pulchrum TaxID=562976 RepID=A0ABP9Y7K4_9FUNG